MAGDVTLWERAVEEVCTVFKVPSLYSQQTDALRKCFSKRDVFVNLPIADISSCSERRIFTHMDPRVRAFSPRPGVEYFPVQGSRNLWSVLQLMKPTA